MTPQHPSDSEEVTHSMSITEVGGNVFLSLPHDQYVNMDPQTAWTVGTKILNAVCRTEGRKGSLVIIKPEIAQ